MRGTIYINGVIGEDTQLIDVIKQVKNQKEATEFLVKINSVGGYVDSGYDIYNYLKNIGLPVSTYTTQAYSIASVIFMAGSTRIVQEGIDNVLMIHCPWMEVAGSYEVITAHLSELKAVEDKLIKFYSEAVSIDKNTIQSLLSKETFLSAEQAKELGFATEIQAQPKAVAMIYNDKKEEEKTSMDKKQTTLLQAIYNKLFGVKAELILQDATGVEVVFPDLADGDMPTVGDKVTVEGKPAEGEYLMPDNTTIVTEKGLVTDIKTAVEEGDTQVEDVPGAKAEQIKEICKWAVEVNNTSFELGETLTYTYEDVQYPLNAGEYELTDGRIVFTDADGVIIKVSEATIDNIPTETSTEDTTANAQAENDEKMLAILAKAVEKNEELEAKYNALAKSIGSDFQPETKKEYIPAIQAKEGDKPKFSLRRK